MKGYIKIIASFLIMLSMSTLAWSLKCFHATPNDATSLYLVRLVQLHDKPTQNTEEQKHDRYLWAEIGVLKIYRGNIERIEALKSIDLHVACSNIWGPDCSILTDELLPFKVGQQWVVVETGEPVPSIEAMSVGVCSGSQLQMDDGSILEQFETEFPPIWSAP